MAYGKTATMDFCVEIKILLIKNEGEPVEKTNQREKEKGNIAIQQKLKSENQGIKKKKIFCTLKNMEKYPGQISR